MEFESEIPNVRMRKLTIEEYLDFIDSHKQLHLTVNHLNQIIGMHGFKKIHKTQKKVLIDVVNSMDLMDPSRSTLENEDVSSCAFITLDEAIKDLTDLHWQECCVTSLHTLNSVNYDHSDLHNAYSSMSKSKPKKPRKQVRNVRGTDTDVIGCGSQSAYSLVVGEECRSRKRNAMNAVGGANVGDFN